MRGGSLDMDDDSLVDEELGIDACMRISGDHGVQRRAEARVAKRKESRSQDRQSS